MVTNEICLKASNAVHINRKGSRVLVRTVSRRSANG